MATTPRVIPPWLLTLQARGVQVIGEVKPRSLFGPASLHHPRATLEWLDSWVDILSIHTDPMWGGSWGWLAEARRFTTKPILAKGFHPSQAHVNRAFTEGANHCLTVGWWNGDSRCWHEVESLTELMETTAPRAVWNTRDPRTGRDRPETVSEALVMRHWKGHASEQWLCQASHIRRPEDVHPGVQAVLIGEALN